MTAPDPTDSGQAPLLSLRSAFVLLLGVLSGVAAGGLTFLSGNGPASSVLTGLCATGTAIAFFNAIIG